MTPATRKKTYIAPFGAAALTPGIAFTLATRKSRAAR